MTFLHVVKKKRKGKENPEEGRKKDDACYNIMRKKATSPRCFYLVFFFFFKIKARKFEKGREESRQNRHYYFTDYYILHVMSLVETVTVNTVTHIYTIRESTAMPLISPRPPRNVRRKLFMNWATLGKKPKLFSIKPGLRQTMKDYYY